MAPQYPFNYLDDSQHRYNDDLLIDDEKRKRAAVDFPELFHILDHEELRRLFIAEDDSANVAKRLSQTAGFWAVD